MLLEVNLTDTLLVGLLVRTMLNVAVPPASVVERPAYGVTVISATSSSSLVAGTATIARLLYFVSTVEFAFRLML